jgi:putative ferrous iron transport protein C
MILSEVKRYLQDRGQATLVDIALHFGAQPDALRPMLEVWMRKGKIERLRAEARCGASCQRCDPAAIEIYRWSAGQPAPPPAPCHPCPR